MPKRTAPKAAPCCQRQSRLQGGRTALLMDRACEGAETRTRPDSLGHRPVVPQKKNWGVPWEYDEGFYKKLNERASSSVNGMATFVGVSKDHQNLAKLWVYHHD